MRNTKILFLILLSISFLTLSFSVNDNIGTKDEEPLTVETLDKWLAIDVKVDLILKKLGEPKVKTSIIFEEATGDYVHMWKYPDKGLDLKMGADSRDKTRVVKSITIIKPCLMKTSKRIGIGTKVSMVKEEYRGLINKSESYNGQIVIGDIYWGTIFFISNNKVSRIFIGAAAE